jgi:hypothetical protein
MQHMPPLLLRVALLALVILAVDLFGAQVGGSPVAPFAARIARAAVPDVPGPCVAGWREMPVPDVMYQATPLDVITRRGRPAWILGGSTDGLRTVRWDGSRWRKAARSRGLQGLTAGTFVGRRLLAVGYERPLSGALRPLSGRLAGSRWLKRRTPSLPPTQRGTLVDVVDLPRGKAWAVGTRLVSGRLHAYALRWTGKRWANGSPSAGRGSGLQAVTRAPGGTIWAVGWRETSTGMPRPWIGRRGRKGWDRVAAPALPPGKAVITDVVFRRAADGWAVGYLAERGADRHTVFLLHWDGRRWRRAALPWAADFGALPRTISVSEDRRLWIAGTQTATEQREVRGFIAHGGGGDWRVDVLAVPDDVRSEVADVAPTRSGAVATGSVGGTAVILHACPVTGPAANRARGRVRVSAVRSRRRVPVEEDHTRDQAVTVPRLTGAAVTPAAPVAPSGFQVRDRSAASGLGQIAKTYQGIAADFDDDGRRDVFYSRHLAGVPRLAMNAQDGYADAPPDAFTHLDRHGCDSADVDQDGRRDILCAIGAGRGKAVKRHELSLAVGSAGRRLARAALGITDPLGRGRQVAFIRLDGDAYPEVFITNAPEREDGLPSYNRFYRNEGGTFVPAPGVGLDSAHGGTCAEVRDIDADGDQDLVYCAGFPFGGRPSGLRIMRNERGRLRDRTQALGARPIGDIDVALADVSGDGRLDLIQLRRDRLRVSRWTSQGYRRIYDARISHGVAVAAGDASGDGRADLYVVRAGGHTGNPRDFLLVSRRGGRDFTSVRIPQTRAGSADDALALDYDGNGLADFVVLNGKKRPGPVQLLASYPE